MVIFHSYVSLPQGTHHEALHHPDVSASPTPRRQPRRQEQLPHSAATELVIRAQQLDQDPGVRWWPGTWLGKARDQMEFLGLGSMEKKAGEI